MPIDHDAFIRAIHDRKKTQLHFYSKEDGRTLTRVCAPMDFGPSRRGADRTDRYHLWDYESDKKPHPISLPPAQIVSMEVLDEQFDPAEFVTWDLVRSPWWIARDWERVS